MAKTSNPPNSTPTALPVNLITGLLGSGKTTAIKHLINQKPDDEHWGILINEIGDIGIDAASLPHNQTTHVLEVSGGCICCTAQFGLTQALNQLLSGDQPLHRILIEPTGLGHPAKIIDTLKQNTFARPLTLSQILCILPPAQLTPTRWQKSAVMRDLVTLSDIILLNKIDQTTPEALTQANTILNSLYPKKTHIRTTRFSQIDLAELNHPHTTPPLLFLSGEKQHQTEITCNSHPYPSRLPGVQQCQTQTGKHTHTIGWIFTPNIQFNRTQLIKLTQTPDTQWQKLTRAKGLLRTGKEWMLINWAENRLTFEDIAWRQDNRLELIFQSPNTPIQFDLIEQSLLNCLQIKPL